MRKLFLALSLVLVFALAACGGGGGDGATQADQVAAGAEVYTAECAECHDAGVGPQMTADVLATHGDAASLHEYISTQMPLDNPGSLTEEQYWDVTAYVMQTAGLLPADTILSADTAGEINLNP